MDQRFWIALFGASYLGMAIAYATAMYKVSTTHKLYKKVIRHPVRRATIYGLLWPLFFISWIAHRLFKQKSA